MSKIKNWAVSKVAQAQTANTEEGQGLAEYGLILALIAVVCIVALQALGGSISSTLQGLSSSI